jgi:EAL domain-containing protein (putative c-di-GMP-specific phosphodiesterase class I)
MVYLSTSIGITIYPNDATDVEVLLKNADQAMYAAKDEGKNRYNYFTASMQQAAQMRMRTANELRMALSNGEFVVHYQPIVELATGNICKAEALVRWQHPTSGLVGPADFIPIAEDTGLVIEIGDYVFNQAANQVARWRALKPDFQISVNKSPVQFKTSKNVHKAWLNHLQALGLAGDALVIEITEGLLLEARESVIRQLQAFHKAGLQIAIDDFGTGYSSLAYLKKFEIDYVKIDRSFTRNIEPGSNDMALCEAIIVMAHKLGLQVIAEGVETVQQRDMLQAAGCDYAQGYLFSRPVPPEEFEKLF